MVARGYDREPDHATAHRGMLRQLLAIQTRRDCRPLLAGVRCPAVVVHGDADSLVPIGAARELASVIPGARLEIIHGMGHELPAGAWNRIVGALVGVAR